MTLSMRPDTQTPDKTPTANKAFFAQYKNAESTLADERPNTCDMMSVVLEPIRQFWVIGASVAKNVATATVRRKVVCVRNVEGVCGSVRNVEGVCGSVRNVEGVRLTDICLERYGRESQTIIGDESGSG
jgi:hypothetical protein